MLDLPSYLNNKKQLNTTVIMGNDASLQEGWLFTCYSPECSQHSCLLLGNMLLYLNTKYLYPLESQFLKLYKIKTKVHYWSQILSVFLKSILWVPSCTAVMQFCWWSKASRTFCFIQQPINISYYFNMQPYWYEIYKKYVLCFTKVYEIIFHQCVCTPGKNLNTHTNYPLKLL